MKQCAVIYCESIIAPESILLDRAVVSAFASLQEGPDSNPS